MKKYLFAIAIFSFLATLSIANAMGFGTLLPIITTSTVNISNSTNATIQIYSGQTANLSASINSTLTNITGSIPITRTTSLDMLEGKRIESPSIYNGSVPYENLGTIQPFSQAEVANIKEQFAPLMGSNAITNVTVEYSSIDLPYGSASSNGTYLTPGANAEYVSLINKSSYVKLHKLVNVTELNGSIKKTNQTGIYNTYTLSFQNVTIIKTIPENFTLTIDGAIIHDPGVYNVSPPYWGNMETYNLNISMVSSLIQGNKGKYSYSIKLSNGSTLLPNITENVSSIKETFNYKLPVTIDAKVVFDFAGDSNYTVDDPGGFVAPTHILYYSNISLDNFGDCPGYSYNPPSWMTVYCNPSFSQNINATPQGMQQYISVPSEYLFSSYTAGNMMNVEFFYPNNGTVIPSWLMTGNSSDYGYPLAPNNALNKSNATLYWIKLNPSIPATDNAVNVIAIGFASKTTDLFSSASDGVAPNLNCSSGCPTIKYGAADSGNVVFNLYTGFEGTSLSTSWVAEGYNTIYSNVVNNGLILPSGVSLYSAETFNTLNYTLGSFGNAKTIEPGDYYNVLTLGWYLIPSDIAFGVGGSYLCITAEGSYFIVSPNYGQCNNLSTAPTFIQGINLYMTLYMGYNPSFTQVLSGSVNSLTTPGWLQGYSPNGNAVVEISSDNYYPYTINTSWVFVREDPPHYGACPSFNCFADNDGGHMYQMPIPTFSQVYVSPTNIISVPIDFQNVSSNGILNTYTINSPSANGFSYYPWKLLTPLTVNGLAYSLNQTINGITTDLFANVANFSYIPPANMFAGNTPSNIIYQIGEQEPAGNNIIQITLTSNMVDISNVLTFNNPIIEYFPNLVNCPTWTSKPISWLFSGDKQQNNPINQTSPCGDIWSNANITFTPNIIVEYPFDPAYIFTVNLLNNPKVQTSITQLPFNIISSNSMQLFPNNRKIYNVSTFDAQTKNALVANTTLSTGGLFNNYSLGITTGFTANNFQIYMPTGNFMNPILALQLQTFISTAPGYQTEINNPLNINLNNSSFASIKIYLPASNASSRYSFIVTRCNGYAINDTIVVATATQPPQQLQIYRMQAMPFQLPLINNGIYNFLIYGPSNVLVTSVGPDVVSPSNLSININSGCTNNVTPLDLPNATVKCIGIPIAGNELLGSCMGIDTTNIIDNWTIEWVNQSSLITQTVINTINITGSSFLTNYTFPARSSNFYAIVKGHLQGSDNPNYVWSFQLWFGQVSPFNVAGLFLGVILILLPVALAYFHKEIMIIAEILMIFIGQALHLLPFSVGDVTGIILCCVAVLIVDYMHKQRG